MYNKLNVAGLNILVDYQHETMLKQAKAYICDFDKEDMVLKLRDEDAKEAKHNNPLLTDNDIEYIFTGAYFYEGLIEHNGMLLHSSAAMVDGKAYLFTADSGIGKSTHTALWQKYLGKDKIKILNDDKPAIRIVEGKVMVYGTPWSGKTDMNINTSAELGAIVCIQRAAENSIEEISSDKAIPLILQQTIRPKEPFKMALMLDILDVILRKTKVYILNCNMSKEAVEISYNTIKVN